MTKIEIYEKIDSCLSQFSNENQSFPKELVDQLNANAAEADKTTVWNILALILAWFASFGIGIGMISEGSLGPFSVAKIQDGLVIMPLLIGIFQYGIASSGLQSIIYRRFLNKIYARLYPKISEYDLDTLLIHPSPFVTSERIVNVFGVGSQDSKMPGDLWINILALSFFLIPFVAFIHVSVISWTNSTLFWFIKAASVFIGFIFFLRGYYMWVLGGDIT